MSPYRNTLWAPREHRPRTWTRALSAVLPRGKMSPLPSLCLEKLRRVCFLTPRQAHLGQGFGRAWGALGAMRATSCRTGRARQTRGLSRHRASSQQNGAMRRLRPAENRAPSPTRRGPARRPLRRRLVPPPWNRRLEQSCGSFRSVPKLCNNSRHRA